MIIIKTPQPDREERLVVVPPGACREPQPGEYREPGCFVVTTGAARDATPDDLARGGWVPQGSRQDLDCVISDLTAQVREARARAEKAERERDDANLTSETWERAAKVVERERNEARTALGRVAIERDEARRLHSAAEAQIECRNELRARLAQAERELDEARAELARLTAVGEGEPTDEALRDAFAEGERNAKRVPIASALRVVYRLGVAHERARFAAAGVTVATAEDAALFVATAEDAAPSMAQPARDRATDEELFAIARAAYDAPDDIGVPWIERIARDVAARVRQERCLVAQAVAANVDVRVCEDNDGRFMVGVHATGCDEVLVREVPTADVPATLARLLGEVSRG